MRNKVTCRREDFAGRWSVIRTIADAYGAQAGRFAGEAVLTPEGESGLVYVEEGVLRMADGPSMTATRTYLWAFDEGGVAVQFADGRAFHRFAPGEAAVEAEHLCAADVYQVTYDFSAWPDWQVRWQVSGPRKDYTMLSRYVRVASSPNA